MPIDTPRPSRDPTVASRFGVLGILFLIVAATACSSDSPPAPAASGVEDASLVSGAAEDGSMTQAAKEERVAPADVGADRADIDEDTTVREVRDTLTGSEQACVREAIDGDIPEAVLDTPVLSDDEHSDLFMQSVLLCVDSGTAREFFISAVVADTAAKTEEEGFSPHTGEGMKACLRSLLADVDVAEWLSETESPEQASEDDELFFGLLACGLDLEMEWTVEDGDDGSFDDAGFDDHADVLDWATYVEVGRDVPGAIDHEGDIDYFVFWAEQGEYYQIDVKLGTLPDSTAALYDDNSFELAFNDDYNETTASLISWQAEYTGDHYIAVESYDDRTGTYTLTVTPDDHAEVLYWEATYVEVGRDVPGAIDHEGDIDYFVFWAEQGEYYQIDVKLGTLPDSTAALYDDNSFELAFNDDYNETTASLISWQAEYTGDHYIAVESYDDRTGTYTLTVTPDDHAEVLYWEATYVEVGRDVPGAIDHEGDIDYFVFWAEQGEYYQIDVKLGTLPDSTAALYDDNSFELAFNDDYNETTASLISWQAEYTGDHYIAVESYDDRTGTYTLTVTPDDHAEVLYWEATYVEVGRDVPGAIDHEGDIDYFVFWAEQGEYYQIDVKLGTLPDSTAALYDDNSFELAFNDDYNETTASLISWQAEYTGDHYIAVESYDDRTGTYTLTVTAI